jgi:YebC/PmpR family DNA-binding regulatory protein
MSGHSKWHSIKHQKGAADKARGKLFARLARQIEVAARQGGGDIETNSLLRLQVQKAKAQSMPKDNIDRAIKRGTGEVEGVNYEEINYEGYAPHGIALYVETLTDNRNRTGSDVKSLFSKNNGSLAEPGSVAWQFERSGLIKFKNDPKIDEDEFLLQAIENGAEDVQFDSDEISVFTKDSALHDVEDKYTKANIKIISADTIMKPTTLVEITDIEHVRQILHLIEILEDNDDVQNVFSNMDASDEILEEIFS